VRDFRLPDSSSHRGVRKCCSPRRFRDRSARAEPNKVTGLTNILREDCMHSTYIDAFTLGLYRRDVGSVRPKMLRGRRFSAVAVLVGLGLLFTAAGARASCFAPSPYKAGAAPAITYVSLHADGEWNENATIVGLWHVLYSATSDDNFPPGGPFPPTPFPFLESFNGTGMEQNLKTRLCHLQAEISASGSGRTWVTTASSCTISV
jgi:hypothetical protein